MIAGKPFNPTTGTSRRPTPEEFVHLRKWVEEVKRSVKITNITEMTNVNQQLEQNAELYVSNIISRVIAQLIGKYGDGFVTLEATSDGKLKVDAGIVAGTTVGLEAGTKDIGSVGLLAGTAEIGKLAAGSAVIGKVQVAGTSRTILQAAVSFASASDNQIVTAVSGEKIKIVNIFLTVAGEVDLTFCSNANVISGAMDFGAADEPRGIVIPFGSFPMETISGEAFKIRANTTVQVSGYCNYYTE